MTDLFSTPRKLKVGQANGEFLAQFAEMTPAKRQTITPRDFPDACPRLVAENVRFNGGPHA